MENVKYHSRFILHEKDEMIAFMSKHNIEILNMIPTKSVLLERKLFKKILKNSMPLILCLKKLAILFYDCLYIVSY